MACFIISKGDFITSEQHALNVLNESQCCAASLTQGTLASAEQSCLAARPRTLRDRAKHIAPPKTQLL